MASNWLDVEIRRGLSKLLCLGIDGAPSVDLISGTAQAWLAAISHRRVWVRERDEQRFRAAFDTLLGSASRWPLPRDLLEALPDVDAQPRLSRDSAIPQTREGRVRHLSELLTALVREQR